MVDFGEPKKKKKVVQLVVDLAEKTKNNKTRLPVAAKESGENKRNNRALSLLRPTTAS